MRSRRKNFREEFLDVFSDSCSCYASAIILTSKILSGNKLTPTAKRKI
jgi:hypothetical protein